MSTHVARGCMEKNKNIPNKTYVYFFFGGGLKEEDSCLLLIEFETTHSKFHGEAFELTSVPFIDLFENVR